MSDALSRSQPHPVPVGCLGLHTFCRLRGSLVQGCNLFCTSLSVVRHVLPPPAPLVPTAPGTPFEHPPYMVEKLIFSVRWHVAGLLCTFVFLTRDRDTDRHFEKEGMHCVPWVAEKCFLTYFEHRSTFRRGSSHDLSCVSQRVLWRWLCWLLVLFVIIFDCETQPMPTQNKIELQYWPIFKFKWIKYSFECFNLN